MFRYLILGLLRRRGPLHGYALMKAYRDRTGIQIGTGNFYRELQRLVVQGLVETAPRAENADPRRAPYAITRSGGMTFDRWFADPDGTIAELNYEDQLSARILFLGDVEPDAASSLLRRCQDDLWMRAKILERMRDSALAHARHTDDGGFPAFRVLIGRRLRHVSADLAVLEDIRTLSEARAVDAGAVTSHRMASASEGHTPVPPDVSTTQRRKPQRR